MFSLAFGSPRTNASVVTIAIGRYTVHLLPYKTHRCWGLRHPACDGYDGIKFRDFGLGGLALFCWYCES